jgi:hypothetical protein
VNFITDLELVALIFSDLTGFVQGKTIAGTTSIGGKTYNVSVVTLPTGPVEPFQVISGSLSSILLLVLTDVGAFEAGAPLQIAVKFGNEWVGLTIKA